MGNSFEHDLSRAFLTSQSPRPDLVEIVIARAEKNLARRRIALTIGTLAGGALAAAMVTGSNLLDGALSGVTLAQRLVWTTEPLIPCVLGAALLIAVAGRNMLRDL